MANRQQWYIGNVRADSDYARTQRGGVSTGGRFEAFTARRTPTQTSHGHIYAAVVGPFKTKRAALWARTYGWLNPHFTHVRDAERLSQTAQRN